MDVATISWLGLKLTESLWVELVLSSEPPSLPRPKPQTEPALLLCSLLVLACSLWAFAFVTSTLTLSLLDPLHSFQKLRLTPQFLNLVN